MTVASAYDPVNNTWANLHDMNENRGFLAAVTGSDGTIYAIGGLDTSFDARVLSSVEAYDPVNNRWKEVAIMPTARMGLAAAAGLDGLIYALGGNNDTSTHLDTVEAYDPTRDTWSPIAPMPTARRDLAAGWSTAHGIDFMYAVGGHGAQFPLGTMEIYIP